MCGILGFTGKKDFESLNQLLEVIEHRGRDERVMEYGGGVNVGMNRLAIIDLHEGLYPMKYKHYVMVYNGEIYNHVALRKKLAKRGIKFKTNSDAEVILPLFDLLGCKGFAELEGMFAIAIVDTRKKEIIVARDKAGEKLLYYALTEQGFIFGSELKVILKSDWLLNKLNLRSLGDYLHHGSIASEETLVSGVRKVLPAQSVIFNLKTSKYEACIYWRPNLDFPLGLKSFGERREKLDDLIKKAVTSRMLSDVPVGAFLSGGVDSSLVTALALEHNSNLKTFSVSFPESSWYDESRYSKKVANFLGTDHTQVDCTAATARPIMERIGELIDEPIVDPAVLPTFLLSKLARASLPVVVTGEGADELFGGYYRFHKQLMGAKLKTVAQKLPPAGWLRENFCPRRFGWIFDDFATQYTPLNVWSHSETRNLLKINSKASLIPEEILKLHLDNPLLAMQLTDIRGYLASQLLMKVDKFCMINNLEARAPYLDSKVMNFALGLGSGDKVRGVNGKYILKKVAESYLPREIVWRVKRGFSLPLGTWFRGEYKDLVERSVDIMHGFDDLFNVGYYQDIVSKHMAKEGENDYRDKIWSLTVLFLWMDYYQVTI